MNASPWTMALALSTAGCKGKSAGDSSTPTDDTSVDSSPPDTAGESCTLVTDVLGSAGGVLATCGASITVPPGRLDADYTFTLAGAEVPTGDIPPFYEQRSDAFAFSATPTLPTTIELRLPHEPFEGRGVWAVVHRDDGSHDLLKPCDYSDPVMMVETGINGTYFAIRQEQSFTPYPSGGEGTLSTLIHGETIDCDFTKSVESFVVYTDTVDGQSILDATCQSADGEGNTTYTRVTVIYDATHTPTNAFYATYEEPTSEGTYSLGSKAPILDGSISKDGRYQLTLTATLNASSGGTADATFTLDAHPALWREPDNEGNCYGGKK